MSLEGIRRLTIEQDRGHTTPSTDRLNPEEPELQKTGADLAAPPEREIGHRDARQTIEWRRELRGRLATTLVREGDQTLDPDASGTYVVKLDGATTSISLKKPPTVPKEQRITRFGVRRREHAIRVYLYHSSAGQTVSWSGVSWTGRYESEEGRWSVVQDGNGDLTDAVEWVPEAGTGRYLAVWKTGAPELSATAGSVDIIDLAYDESTQTWVGSLAGTGAVANRAPDDGTAVDNENPTEDEAPEDNPVEDDTGNPVDDTPETPTDPGDDSNPDQVGDDAGSGGLFVFALGEQSKHGLSNDGGAHWVISTGPWQAATGVAVDGPAAAVIEPPRTGEAYSRLWTTAALGSVIYWSEVEAVGSKVKAAVRNPAFDLAAGDNEAIAADWQKYATGWERVSRGNSVDFFDDFDNFPENWWGNTGEWSVATDGSGDTYIRSRDRHQHISHSDKVRNFTVEMEYRCTQDGSYEPIYICSVNGTGDPNSRGDNRVAIYRANDGDLRLEVGEAGSARLYQTIGNLAAGQWYDIRLDIEIGAAGRVRVIVDGAELIDATVQTKDGSADYVDRHTLHPGWGEGEGGDPQRWYEFKSFRLTQGGSSEWAIVQDRAAVDGGTAAGFELEQDLTIPSRHEDAAEDGRMIVAVEWEETSDGTDESHLEIDWLGSGVQLISTSVGERKASGSSLTTRTDELACPQGTWYLRMRIVADAPSGTYSAVEVYSVAASMRDAAIAPAEYIDIAAGGPGPKFVTVGKGGMLAYRSGGEWRRGEWAIAGPFSDLVTVAGAYGLWITADQNGQTQTSTDGVAWTQVADLPFGDPRFAISQADIIMAASRATGGGLAISTTGGASWTDRTPSMPGTGPASIAWMRDRNRWVLVYATGSVFYSDDDGANWTGAAQVPFTGLGDLAGVHAAVGSNADGTLAVRLFAWRAGVRDVIWSDDGDTWWIGQGLPGVSMTDYDS